MKKITSVYDNPYSDKYANNAIHAPVVPDWSVALSTPFDHVEKEMIDDLNVAAGDWSICAVGNICDAIPRDHDGTPQDDDLLELGYDFNNYVLEMSKAFHDANEDRYETMRAEALEAHKAIEDRATALLVEMGLMGPS